MRGIEGMSGYNLPPGVYEHDLPGNRPEDCGESEEAWDTLLGDIHEHVFNSRGKEPLRLIFSLRAKVAPDKDIDLREEFDSYHQFDDEQILGAYECLENEIRETFEDADDARDLLGLND